MPKCVGMDTACQVGTCKCTDMNFTDTRALATKIIETLLDIWSGDLTFYLVQKKI